MWYPCHHSRGTTDLSENQSLFALTQYCFKCSVAQYLSYPAKKYILLFTAFWLIHVIAQCKSQIKVNIKLYYLEKYMICYIIWNNSPLLCWRWNKYIIEITCLKHSLYPQKANNGTLKVVQSDDFSHADQMKLTWYAIYRSIMICVTKYQ